MSRSITWSKLEVVWILGASLVLSATACIYADWFYYVAAMCFIMHFILLGRGDVLGFLFGGVGVCLYGIYSVRLGMAVHLWAQGLYLVINFIGAIRWHRYRKSFIPHSLPAAHDILLSLVLVCGTGVVAYNLIAYSDIQESLRPFTIIGACVGTFMVVFEFHERWWVWMQVCSIAAVLWIMHLVQTGYGVPGMMAWLCALVSVVICQHTSRT